MAGAVNCESWSSSQPGSRAQGHHALILMDEILHHVFKKKKKKKKKLG